MGFSVTIPVITNDSFLIKEKLIDEFYLFINPLVLSSGKTIQDYIENQKL
jgi:riboflavin biosynthesis pyrimidine reductase